MKLKRSYHVYAIITIIFWSLAYVPTRLALPYFSVYALGFLRYLIASCVLLVFILIYKIKAPKTADIKWFILSGAVGFFLYMITFNIGCKTVTACTSSIIIATVPMISALLARIIYQEQLRYVQIIAMIIEFVGVLVLTLMQGIFSINKGLIWLIAAALCLSFYNLLQRKLTKAYNWFQTSAYSIFTGTLMLGIFSQTALQEIQTAPPIQLMYIAILGIFSSAIAYVTWSLALKKAKKTSSVCNYMFITPFLVSLLGYVFAHEKLDMSAIIGGGIILFGVAIFNFGDKIFRHINHN